MTSPFEEWWEANRNNIGVTEQLEEPRMLRARWSMELQEDLQAVHGINAEDALAEILAEEVANEMEYESVMIPMVRRLMPQLMAGDIVGVQPLGSPVGHVFSLRYNPDDMVNRIQVQDMKKDHFQDNEELFKI